MPITSPGAAHAGGFGLDSAPVGATGQASTLHLKNSDVAPVAGGAPRFEVCTDDVARATAWSEAKAVATTPYGDLVESNVSGRTWEFVRVPRGDAGARVRHRVFRCSYLDRSGTDLAAATGAAGSLRARSADAAGGCDRIELLRWTHTLDTGSGALGRRLETTGSFAARRDGGGAVQRCTP